MFASTQTLPPWTKRWAEAKVLADCVAVKVGEYSLSGSLLMQPRFAKYYYTKVKV